MAILGLILMAVGGIIMLVCGIWLLVLAFQESVLWGIGCLVFGPIGLIFVIMHWDVSKKPFLYNLGGAALIGIGVVVAGLGAPQMEMTPMEDPAPIEAPVEAPASTP